MLEKEKAQCIENTGFVLVDHQGFDRQFRVARRLPPQLP